MCGLLRGKKSRSLFDPPLISYEEKCEFILIIIFDLVYVCLILQVGRSEAEVRLSSIRAKRKTR